MQTPKAADLGGIGDLKEVGEMLLQIHSPIQVIGDSPSLAPLPGKHGSFRPYEVGIMGRG